MKADIGVSIVTYGIAIIFFLLLVIYHFHAVGVL